VDDEEMHVEDSRLSQAVVAYLAKGRSPFPRSDDEAVLEFAGEQGGAELLARVREITAEMMAIPIDWSTHSLVEGGREAQRRIAELHPELGSDALDALYWMFTYNWR
jgi:hypothetical protein